MARQTKERAEQTRERIIDAAEQVFYRRGVARASLEEIAREAGVTRGAVYWHFSDKVEVFIAVEHRAQQPYEQMRAALRSSVSHAGNAEEAMQALETSIVEAFERIQSDELARLRLTVMLLRCDYVGEMAPALERQTAITRLFFSELQHYFNVVIPPPAPGSDWQPEDAAQVLQVVVHGSFMRWLRSPDEFPIGKGVIAIKAFIAALRKAWIPNV
ncbi:TetR family transcriptional regulator (plasmid) [Lichenicola cladoniae]|uniref:TetR family transcriptional regulator n=1 Tax=Lichenicola cladoniae TaxID=1484109 RepID=A0A6M8HYY2_9PROT|nr:TetR family transcriptional regulator [Lichenicola cladoniae]NPD66640.1 TetR family transcriptional regulator [Acetobacteraceae bacterium]QKE93749.1 TetR family transcriptional regulator [Lichenicola cladoniae]